MWWLLNLRFILRTSNLHVPRSLAKILRRGDYRVTMDQAFPEVIARCATQPRPGQPGTWITGDMRRAYERLHQLGHAHSVEAWEGDTLVGGLYGVAVGRLYCGESMFADRPDASKVAFVRLAQQLAAWGFPLVDCQVYTDHLARFGAEDMPRATFLAVIEPLARATGRVGRWSFDVDPDQPPAR